MDIVEAKQALRATARERRRSLAPAAMAAAAERLRDRFLAAVPIEPGAAVSGYWPFADELDPRPLLTALAVRGHPIALPVTVRRGEPLLFRRWQPGMALV